MVSAWRGWVGRASRRYPPVNTSSLDKCSKACHFLSFLVVLYTTKHLSNTTFRVHVLYTTKHSSNTTFRVHVVIILSLYPHAKHAHRVTLCSCAVQGRGGVGSGGKTSADRTARHSRGGMYTLGGEWALVVDY